MRALYRSQLYCNVFGVGNIPDHGGRNSPRRVRFHKDGVFEMFLLYEPWEFEDYFASTVSPGKCLTKSSMICLMICPTTPTVPGLGKITHFTNGRLIWKIYVSLSASLFPLSTWLIE